MPTATVTLDWQCFPSMTAARDAFRDSPCVYAQANDDGVVVRVGKASKGLNARYRGGTAWAIDAAMDGSGNLVFVAGVDAGDCAAVEATLTGQHREHLPHNDQGERRAPRELVRLQHAGERPTFR